jgi:hypothetical protein
MTEKKVNIYTPAGNHVGYFVNPQVECLGENDFEIKGEFFDNQGVRVLKLDFNPESLPYSADLAQSAQGQLKKVYVQRGRQPIVMTGEKAK